MIGKLRALIYNAELIKENDTFSKMVFRIIQIKINKLKILN